MMYVGIDVGGTSIKYGLVDEHAQVFEKGAVATPKDKPAFLAALTAIIQNYQQAHPIAGVGISAPGIIQKDGLMTTAGALYALYGTNLKDEIEARTQLPTVIENDANAAAIAEKWVGNAQELDNYLCIVLGTGVGGGIVINGQVYRGARGMAGEFGWAIVNDLTAEENIETSSLNWRISVVGGLCRSYNHALQATTSTLEPIKDAREIFQRSQQNDELAKQILQDFYQNLAIGMLNLISQFDPEAILIGGGISANEQFWTEFTQVLQTMEDRHDSIRFMKNYGWAPVIPAKLKNDAGIIGAVYPLSVAKQH